MSILRFLMLLSLTVWLGGIIFFSFVVAPTAFSVLPTRHMAGSSSDTLLGFCTGWACSPELSSWASSMLLASLTTGSAHLRRPPHPDLPHAGAHGDFAIRDFPEWLRCAPNLATSTVSPPPIPAASSSIPCTRGQSDRDRRARHGTGGALPDVAPDP